MWLWWGLDYFEIWWWFDCMSVLYDKFILWVVDLVIDEIIIHDLFMVDELCDDLYMELACIMIYNNLITILLKNIKENE